MSRLPDQSDPGARGRAVEMLVLLVVSVIGIYALGQGLSGLFEPGRGINLLWLAVTGVAIWVLVAQMARVHDAWPRRDQSEDRLALSTSEDDAETIVPRSPSAIEGDSRT